MSLFELASQFLLFLCFFFRDEFTVSTRVLGPRDRFPGRRSTPRRLRGRQQRGRPAMPLAHPTTHCKSIYCTYCDEFFQ